MPETITEDSEFSADVTVPTGGDPRTAASVRTAFQQLANRSRWLMNRPPFRPSSGSLDSNLVIDPRATNFFDVGTAHLTANRVWQISSASHVADGDMVLVVNRSNFQITINSPSSVALVVLGPGSAGDYDYALLARSGGVWGVVQTHQKTAAFSASVGFFTGAVVAQSFNATLDVQARYIASTRGYVKRVVMGADANGSYGLGTADIVIASSLTTIRAYTISDTDAANNVVLTFVNNSPYILNINNPLGVFIVALSDDATGSAGNGRWRWIDFIRLGGTWTILRRGF